MITDNIKLYSWVDVQDQLLQAEEIGNWKKGIKAEVYSSGLYIYHEPEVDEAEITEWLKNVFPTAVEENKRIRLERFDNGERHIPIIMESQEKIESSPFVPSFTRPRSIIEGDIPVLDKKRLNETPTIIATHSFKGGVGRTLHAIALASELEIIDDSSSVLFVDGDFEAPGTTWLTPDPEISFADVLNLVHGSSDPFSIVNTVKESVENQAKGNIYFLPAFRTERQMGSLEVKPEHIFRFANNPFILTDIIAQLGGELGVKYIIIDLRAGVSELSASWLLDPRVSNIYVTTLNSQSVEGTIFLLDLLAEKQKKYGITPTEAPAIIISQVNPELEKSLSNVWNMEEEPSSNTAAQNIYKLKSAYLDYLDRVEVSNDDTPIIISPHYDTLLVLSNDWDSVKQLIRRSGLAENMHPLVQFYKIPPASTLIPDSSSLEESRKKMLETLPDLVYAEKHLPDHFYKSIAIRNLANRNKTRLPNLVVVGAKGAGKTFLYRQILRSGSWRSFLNQSIDYSQEGYQEAKIEAVTFPEQVDEKALNWVKVIKPYLISKLKEELTTTEWRNVWLDIIAWSGEYKVEEVNVGDAYVEFLRKEDKKIVFVFDGLEDLFPNYFQDESQQIALRALLQDVVSYIGVIPGAPLGIVTFIRKDMVEHAIKQNLGQFLDRYKEYELKWNRTEALRLVAWIMKHYDIMHLENIKDQQIPSTTQDQLIEDLVLLWGRKLGSDQSREARSANKILSILSNFNEEVQSRDLVRFLAEAIKTEMSSATADHYPDRILSPKSVKNAFPEVGKRKVEEVKEENQNNSYSDVLGRLEAEASNIKVPSENLGDLSTTDINLLVSQGVLKRHDNKYYMAELFRLGFGIDKRKGRVKTEFPD